MKLHFIPRLSFLLGVAALVVAGSLRAEEIDVNAPLNPQQVDQLLGPIALYPDALVAIILPASTYPSDIVLAQRYLSAGGDPDKIEDQPWNDSVKALARYPMLIKWLDENLTWTRQLGATFLYQPNEVMGSVQRLRVRAKANGALTSTSQQKLLLDGDDIEIVPAQPDVIYVPYYDPNLVYGEPGYYGRPPYVTFGLGVPIGFWLSYDFNWRSRAIIVGDRHHNWAEHRDWDRRGGSSGRPSNVSWRPWTPPAGRPPYSRPDDRRPRQGDIGHPQPVPGGPPMPSRGRSSDQPLPDNHSTDSNRSHPPMPSANPGWNRDNHDQRGPATPSRPATNTSAGNPPWPTGPSNQPPPRTSGNPDANRDHHDRQPAPPTAGPHPDSVPPRSAGQPNPTPPPANPGNRQPPTRPMDARPNVVPASPHNAPPPPPPKDRSRDDKPEVQH